MNITEQELKILKIIGILIALFVIYQLLKKIGIIGGMSKEAGLNLTEQASQNKGFGTDLRTEKIPLVKKLSPSEQLSIAKQIYQSMHFSGVGVKDATLVNAFFKIKSKYQLSQLSKTYQSLYKIELLSDLTKTLRDSIVNRQFGGNEAYKKIIEYTETLPLT